MPLEDSSAAIPQNNQVLQIELGDLPPGLVSSCQPSRERLEVMPGSWASLHEVPADQRQVRLHGRGVSNTGQHPMSGSD